MGDNKRSCEWSRQSCGKLGRVRLPVDKFCWDFTNSWGKSHPLAGWSADKVPGRTSSLLLVPWYLVRAKGNSALSGLDYNKLSVQPSSRNLMDLRRTSRFRHRFQTIEDNTDKSAHTCRRVQWRTECVRSTLNVRLHQANKCSFFLHSS